MGIKKLANGRCKWGRNKKLKYTYEAACKAIDKIRREKRNRFRQECRIYYCRHCDGYHLTSQEYKRIDVEETDEKEEIDNEPNGNCEIE